MAADDWFRSLSWDDDSRTDFEARLDRALPASRPQYLRIKGLALLEANDDDRRRAGAALLHRMLDEYSDNRVECAAAHVALARYAEESHDSEGAVRHYRETLRLERGTSSCNGAELRLAELIIHDAAQELYSEADELLDAVVAAGPIFRVEQFRYAVARSRLALQAGRNDEAAAFACGALALFEDNRPVSSYHQDIGLIRADDATLAELQQAASEGSAESFSDRVERFRGPDGAVQWEWSLTSRLRGVAEGSRLQAQDEFDTEAEPLVNELRAAGFEVYDLHEWAGRSLANAASVKAAAPILLSWLEKAKSPELKTTIATALTDRRFRSVATTPLLDLFRQMDAPELNGLDWPEPDVGRQRRLKDRVANALATLARDAHFEEVAHLIRDRRHGRYRAYLFWAVAYMKSEAAVDLAIEMLGDNEVHLPALRALSDLRSERAAAVLEPIAAEPRPRGRNEKDEMTRDRIDIARAGVEKLAKARAKGRSRP